MISNSIWMSAAPEEEDTTLPPDSIVEAEVTVALTVTGSAYTRLPSSVVSSIVASRLAGPSGVVSVFLQEITASEITARLNKNFFIMF